MQVIIINKKTWIAVLICIALIGAAAAAYFVFHDREAEQTEPTMATVDVYELNTIPVNSRFVPVYQVGRTDHAIALTIDAAWSADKTQFILDTLDRSVLQFQQQLRVIENIIGKCIKVPVPVRFAQNHLYSFHSASSFNRQTAPDVSAHRPDP